MSTRVEGDIAVLGKEHPFEGSVDWIVALVVTIVTIALALENP